VGSSTFFLHHRRKAGGIVNIMHLITDAPYNGRNAMPGLTIPVFFDIIENDVSGYEVCLCKDALQKGVQ
jgi:hypothetical protein